MEEEYAMSFVYLQKYQKQYKTNLSGKSLFAFFLHIYDNANCI